MKTEDYNSAITYCDEGINISATHARGKLMPDFLYNKALAGCKLGRTDRVLFQKSYFGYMLLYKAEKAQQVLASALKHNAGFDTYGTENLDCPQLVKIPYKWGSIPECKTLGEMIRLLREQAKLSQGALCRGICDKPTLSRIENNEIEGNLDIIAPIMQRLGRDVYMYCNFFLRRKDFDEELLRQKIW